MQGCFIRCHYVYRLVAAYQLADRIEEEERNRTEYEIAPNDDFPATTEEDINQNVNITKKSRGRPKKAIGGESSVAWSDEDINLLITAWQDEEVLYNVKHALYFRKDEKEKALERVCVKLAEHITVTSKQVSDNITSLKTYFGAEKRKVDNSARKSGSGTNELYRPKWQFYEQLIFLSDSFTPRGTESNIDMEVSETSSAAEVRSVNTRKRKANN